MAGELYRAVARTGGLDAAIQPIVDSFRAIAEKNRRDKATADMMSWYSQFKDKLGSIQNATNDVTTTNPNPMHNVDLGPAPVTSINDILSPKPLQTKLASNTPVGMNSLTPSNMFNEQVSQPETYSVTNKTPISDEEKYKNAQNAYGDMLAQIIGNPNSSSIDSNKLNLLNSIMSKSVENMRPEPLQKLDLAKGAKAIMYNSRTGKVVNEITNPEEQKSFVEVGGISYPKNPDGSIDWNNPNTQPRDTNPSFKIGSNGNYLRWDNKTKGFVDTKQKAPAKDWLTDKQINGDNNKVNSYASVMAGLEKLKEYDPQTLKEYTPDQIANTFPKDFMLSKPQENGYIINNKYVPKSLLDTVRKNERDKYVKAATSMVEEDPDLSKAAENIGEGIKQGLSSDKAIKIYKSINPGLSRMHEKKLRAYFDLMEK